MATLRQCILLDPGSGRRTSNDCYLTQSIVMVQISIDYLVFCGDMSIAVEFSPYMS